MTTPDLSQLPIDISKIKDIEAFKIAVNKAKGAKNIENFEDRCIPVFKPFLKPARYKGAHGGRGSGKSHFFAEMIIIFAATHKGARIVCLREIQKSLKQSVKRLLEDKIQSLDLGHLFEVLETEIKCPGGGLIIFQGLQSHTADSIKSLEGFDIAWVEEAQSLSNKSLSLLRPTMRKTGSELWFTWNPELPSDPIDQFLRPSEIDPKTGQTFSLPEGAIVLQVNWQDNPYFPKELQDEKDYDKNRDLDRYKHVWEGGYLARSESRVFHRWCVEEFDTPEDARFLMGADWGFSVDPTTLVRMFVGRWFITDDGNKIAINDPSGRNLFIDYEAYKVGCTIEKTPELFDTVPESRNWPIRADSARPETIDYMKRNGFPRIERATKGKNSVNDGVEFLKSYDIVVHPRCTHMEDELIHYSYKIDPKTDEILPELEDDWNHLADSCRYATELIRRAQKFGQSVSAYGGKSLEDDNEQKTLKKEVSIFVGKSLDNY